jgi:hypothetical protein
MRRKSTVSAWTKSTATIPRACAVKNCFQVGRAPRCRIDPGWIQDLPHRGGGDRMAEPDELTLHAPVPTRRVLRRHADHQLPDRGWRGRSSRPPPVRAVPFAADEMPVPGEQRCPGHHEHLAPSVPGDQPRQGGEPQPAGRLVADPADLAQHRVLVPEHQALGILGHPTPGQHHRAGEETAHAQADDREDHSAMIPTLQAAQPDPVIEPHKFPPAGPSHPHRRHAGRAGSGLS